MSRGGVRKVPKKCHVLSEWPLTEKVKLKQMNLCFYLLHNNRRFSMLIFMFPRSKILYFNHFSYLKIKKKYKINILNKKCVQIFLISSFGSLSFFQTNFSPKMVSQLDMKGMGSGLHF